MNSFLCRVAVYHLGRQFNPWFVTFTVWRSTGSSELWWGSRDSNPDAFRHMILNHARLPIPTLPHWSQKPSNGGSIIAYGAPRTDNPGRVSMKLPP